MPWKALRQCWALPHADAATRAVLLDRQLRNLFRVIPWYVASNRHHPKVTPAVGAVSDHHQYDAA